MASIINATTSSGVVINSDNTGQLQLQTAGTNALNIDASQNVGIGTASPTATFGTNVLQMYGSAATEMRFTSGTTGTSITDGLSVGIDSSSIAYLYNRENQPIVFGTNNIERMRIDSSGNVLLGTTTNTPGYKLYVKGGDGNQLILDNAGSTYTTMNYYNNGSNKLTSFWDNTTPRYYIVPAAGGGVYLAAGGTSWTSASDERVKDIIEPITDAANKVSTLRAVIGKYKTDEEGTRRAFLIAQDVHQVFPEAVDTANENEYGLRYQDTIPLLVAAIKELTERVKELENK